jgi:superfamily II DNA or RNA helicase
VVGARMIAARGLNTLVLVHRRQLVGQWRERLKTFLSMDDSSIGTIGGGKRKPSGRIDIALIQSLVRNGEVNDLIGDHGHLIVDECHHLSAVSFELVARRSKARYVLGLSATIARKDGHHPIIFMQCGPVRYRVDAKSQAATRPFSHKVTIRETGFQLAPDLESQSPTQITAIYAALAKDEKRNDRIFDDVLRSLEAGRRPVILTERRDHLDHLRGRFQHFTKNLVVLYGGMTTAERREAEERLKTSHTEERLVLATGRYLGEGFDDASLDTLFLTMPISWTRHARAVRRSAAPRAPRQACGHRLRLRRLRRAAPCPHCAQAPDWVSQPRLRNFAGSRSCDGSCENGHIGRFDAART